MVKKLRRFTNEQIAQASDINIIAYAESRDFDVKKISPRSYKIPGYGGLYINADGHKWNCFSKGTGGGAIQFVMEMEGKTWVESIKQLLGTNHEELPFIPPIPKELEIKGDLILPEKNDTYKHIFAYLIKTRKIDKDVVTQFVKDKKIYEDVNRNCVFVGYDDDNKPRYASVRGTNTNKRFRRDIENSDKGYPVCVNGKTDTLLVFESAIDLMSYLTLLKNYGVEEFNHHMISMGGMSYLPIQNYLEKHAEISKMTLCLDSDEEGNMFSEKIIEKYVKDYEIARHIPKGKDFNEEIVKEVSMKADSKSDFDKDEICEMLEV
ncbi:MAG: DUF3991 domain-containing protein [Alkaliphilus sp.]